MWDLPGPWIEPTSPAVAGGFLTTGPPGKSVSVLKSKNYGDGWWLMVAQQCECI